jgi:two-component system OmpR family sensor kinase
MDIRIDGKRANTRMRSSALSHASGSPRPRRPKSSAAGPSFLDLPDRAEILGMESPNGKTEPGQVLGGKLRELEYLGQKFNELVGRLQDHEYTQNRCLRDVSHELKAPISRIRVLLDRARNGPQGIADYLSKIEENVLRMESLTKRLLDFSRLELNQEPPAREQCDLADLVRRVVEDARIEAGSRGCTIKQSTVAQCPAFVNQELLHRAVENVIRNSVQHTRKNSAISVVLSCPSNGMARIVVDDEGPGISEEELKRVFEPFYRAAQVPANGTLGAGLGLAIAQRALALHGGSISARNRADGRGLQVTLQIPHRG